MRTLPRLAVLLAALLAPTATVARPVVELPYHQGAETVVTCPVGFYCSVALDVGERVTDGYASDVPEWTPHTSYVGYHNARPYILLFPNHAGLRSNFIVMTDRRSYYLTLLSDNDKEPAYYAMTFPDDMRGFHDAQRAAARAAQAPDPRNCIDDRYGIDRMAVFYYPAHVCNDGRHTFIVLQQFRETPSDLPLLFSVVDGSTTLTNYRFDAAHYRYIVDGVPDMLVLVTGSGKNKRTMRVQHMPMPITPEKKKR